jgi:hypothetical protein
VKCPAPLLPSSLFRSSPVYARHARTAPFLLPGAPHQEHRCRLQAPAPASISLNVGPPPLISSPSSSLRGEHHFPPCLPLCLSRSTVPPPCGARRHGRRSHLPGHLDRFSVLPAPRRTCPHPNPWPLARNRAMPANFRAPAARRRRKPTVRCHALAEHPCAPLVGHPGRPIASGWRGLNRGVTPLAGPPWTHGPGPSLGPRLVSAAPTVRSVADDQDQPAPPVNRVFPLPFCK